MEKYKSKMKSNSFFVMRPVEESYKGLVDMIEYMNKSGRFNPETMIEIGSYVGESTTIFANHFKKVISIDPFINDYDVNDLVCEHADFDIVYRQFLSNMSKFNNIQHIRKLSSDAVSSFALESVDFVYIDGCHTYDQVKKDIINYLPVVKKGGFIGGHDYTGNWPQVVKAVNDILVKVDSTFVDGSWVKEII